MRAIKVSAANREAIFLDVRPMLENQKKQMNLNSSAWSFEQLFVHFQGQAGYYVHYYPAEDWGIKTEGFDFIAQTVLHNPHGYEIQNFPPPENEWFQALKK